MIFKAFLLLYSDEDKDDYCGTSNDIDVNCISLQATTATDEVLPVVPPADPSQCPDLSAVQGQESVPQPEETQEEGPVKSIDGHLYWISGGSSCLYVEWTDDVIIVL